MNENLKRYIEQKQKTAKHRGYSQILKLKKDLKIEIANKEYELEELETYWSDIEQDQDDYIESLIEGDKNENN